MGGPYAIRAERLTRKFGDFTAVDNIDLEVKKGEVFGFLGANGAGKTTAIRMFCGLLKPTSGAGEVAGFDIVKQQEKVKRSIGYMSQRFSLYDDLTAYENIRFYGGIYGLTGRQIRDKSEQLLKRLGLFHDRNMPVKSLPLGWKQKLAFSVASVHDPKIVFLDEPTSGVDPIVRRQFWKMIYEAAEAGSTIFVTTHYMEEAEYCHRISIMANGRIVAMDTPASLKNHFQASNIHDIFLKLTRPAQ
jgi:ABC-2 type transport system ATP-binding protein